jgi:hypothetical protein
MHTYKWIYIFNSWVCIYIYILYIYSTVCVHLVGILNIKLICWDVTPCSVVQVFPHFGGTLYLHPLPWEPETVTVYQNIRHHLSEVHNYHIPKHLNVPRLYHCMHMLKETYCTNNITHHNFTSTWEQNIGSCNFSLHSTVCFMDHLL